MDVPKEFKCTLSKKIMIDELITQWCLLHKFELPKSSQEIVTDGISSLLQRISSPSSVKDQTKAAEELRSQTKRFANENLITTLFNLSIVAKNKTVIAETPLVIPLLTNSLKQGTAETRRNSAATLLSLSAVDSNRLLIGNSKTLNALIGLTGEGGLFITEAASQFSTSIVYQYQRTEKRLFQLLIPVLTHKIKEGSNVAELLPLLALLSTHNRGVKEMNDLGYISDLLSIFRKPSCPEIHENAVVIVFNMLNEEENQYGTFTKLARQGSDRAVRKADAILKWLKRHGTGKESQRG
ncbi:unnamed protein product [Eruca vesicaria subsp. sativa]|uniref:Uncharacterized protein n=1 Tax=Eruca vesicaria subsp. sativa TaxID=29727 RepID=A0ABC8L6I0_ERUVS|nr:unnamed protein product [Eruca vesicaria subsp. sativa]